MIGFVGRLVRDKGVVELATAWRSLREDYPSLHLLVVGRREAQDPVPPETMSTLESDPRVHVTGELCDLPPVYTAMDVFVLPTYREGLSLALLEAAAMCLPCVATRVTGSTDAIVEGATGTLVPAGDAGALAGAIRSYLDNLPLSRAHGLAGRAFVLEHFPREAIWEALLAEYQACLAAKDSA